MVTDHGTKNVQEDVLGLVLAGGKGTRMNSELPKVLLPILKEPMIWYVYQALSQIIPEEKIWTVVGHKKELLEENFEDRVDKFIRQNEQLGTGHALKCALPFLKKNMDQWVLVINGDAPLIKAESIYRLIQRAKSENAEMAFMSIELDDPTGYGRIIRDDQGKVCAIKEDKDLDNDLERKSIREVNAGVYCLKLKNIDDRLNRIKNDNIQGEYYLTDLLELILDDGGSVLDISVGRDPSLLGVNNNKELIYCESLMKKELIEKHLQEGVILRGQDLIRIGPRTKIEPGVEITGPAEIYGNSILSSGTCLESHVWIKDSYLGPDCLVRSFSHIERAYVESKGTIGPFARLRPEVYMEQGVKAGNFVEIKKSRLGSGCKVNHLSYLGDAYIGEGSNIGAGTITCNYDGKRKHITKIGKNAFIGSNAALVAPVEIGDNSIVGAGSTISKRVPDNTLAVERSKQKNLNRKIKKSE